MKGNIYNFIKLPENIDTKHYRFLVVINNWYVIAFSAHVIFIPLFYSLGLYNLVLFNLFISCPVFAICHYINRNNHETTAFILSYLEVIFHASISTFYVGWSSGFHLHIILIIPLIIYNPYFNNVKKLGFISSAVLTYGLMIFFFQGKITYTGISHPNVLNASNYINHLIFFILLSSVSYYYFKATQIAEKTLQSMSRTDDLTKLANRRHVVEKIKDEQIRFIRNSRCFVILLADIDDFKSINDDFGHDCGDYILTAVADILNSLVRNIDTVSRWGGEEFLILLPETDKKGGEVMAERMRKNISENFFKYKNTIVKITMTFGASVYKKTIDMESIIKEADLAMYKGKASGKNCVVFNK